MSEYLVPLNQQRTRDMMRGLGFFTSYSKKGAERVRELLHTHYPRLFERMEERQFKNGAFTLEMTGASITDPLSSYRTWTASRARRRPRATAG